MLTCRQIPMHIKQKEIIKKKRCGWQWTAYLQYYSLTSSEAKFHLQYTQMLQVESIEFLFLVTDFQSLLKVAIQ